MTGQWAAPIDQFGVEGLKKLRGLPGTMPAGDTGPGS